MIDNIYTIFILRFRCNHGRAYDAFVETNSNDEIENRIKKIRNKHREVINNLLNDTFANPNDVRAFSNREYGDDVPTEISTDEEE